MSKLSVYIRSERERRNWSQRELARRSGIPASTISRWENDELGMLPEYGQMLKLAVALGVDADTVTRSVGYVIKESPTIADQEDRFNALRPQIENDPRAQRILDLFFDPRVTDSQRDTALTILEAHLRRGRR